MKEIPMVDLKGQYMKIKGEIDAGISEVIENTSFIGGPAVKQFQQELASYLGVKHVIGCANGTDALQIAMMALGLKPGDEVITTNFTFIATVEVIALLRLTPVLVDVEPNYFNIDIDKLRKAITPQTKAIVPVHLFGQCANMEEIMKIALEHNLFVIEDTAQALGSDYYFSNGASAKAGTIGQIGTTSFFPSKNLGCYGDGGALMTNDDDLAYLMQSIVNHGMRVRYYHERIGVNSRLDSIQAAVLRAKLPHLDAYIEARNMAADFYSAAFAGNENIIPPARNSYSKHTFHQYTLKLRNIDRNALQNHLKEKGIASAVYYPVPLHMQDAFRGYSCYADDYPVTEYLCKSVLSLPIHTEMQRETLQYISDSVLEFAYRRKGGGGCGCCCS
ncbi:MAG TPA: DegT/DnrJ/EryC1/StrS family aminotransferase [Bacteroidales bacterium]|nr:DegT/DnrJ/EryC1/StrS family aminotransferase [Bacteroidales bacterium]